MVKTVCNCVKSNLKDKRDAVFDGFTIEQKTVNYLSEQKRSFQIKHDRKHCRVIKTPFYDYYY